MRSGIAVLSLMLPLTLSAQGVSIRGLAYDSLRGAPLAGALVAISGTSRTTISDARGRFSFDSVTPGPHTFVMQHDVLDSIGLSGRTTRATIDEAYQSVIIAVPSFATLWRAACGPSTPPRDSGIVYGFVRSSTDESPVRNARVGVIWRDVSYEEKAGFGQKDWGAQVSVDTTGRYALCGVPQSVGLQIVAANDSLMSGRVELSPLAIRVLRRDFLLAPAASRSGDTDALGTIVGDLMGENGRAVANAIVMTEGAPEVRSGDDGHFVLHDVPAGTRQIEVRSIGSAPIVATVDVRARDTTNVAIKLNKVTTLAEVTVKARRFREVMVRDITERRRSGLGYYRDSLTIGHLPTMPSVFDGFAGIKVDRGRRGTASQFRILTLMGGQCAVWIDRVELDGQALYLLAPDLLAAVEVYPRNAPEGFRSREFPGCSVVVWTKRYLK